MSSGSSACRGAPPRRSSSPRSIPRRARCSRATRGAVSSVRGSRLLTWAEPRRSGPVTGWNSSAVTARSIVQRGSREEADFRDGPAPGSIPAVPSARWSSYARADMSRPCCFSARRPVKGEVKRGWPPPAGRGVRTRISDDRLWFPYVVKQYVETTGDWRLLDEVVPFLEGPLLTAEQSDSYFEPRVAEEQASVFEHCARALDCSLSVGSHGLPLMGTGDWNDGMNLVGAEGKGESVWLAWFLHPILSEWAAVAEARGEGKRATTWRGHASALKESLEREAWDGGWYRRAYFDDGTPLGSAVNDACRIDSIAQSWSVISGGTDAARSKQAMSAVDETLVRPGDGLVLLLTPPFDGTPLEAS